MKDLRLDTTTHDLVITNGDLSLVEKLEFIQQNMKQNYQFFLGEWFLDITKGVPYYQFILVKNPNLDVVNSTLMNVALKVPGVMELQDFTLDYDRARIANVTLQAKCTEGDLYYTSTLGG